MYICIYTYIHRQGAPSLQLFSTVQFATVGMLGEFADTFVDVVEHLRVEQCCACWYGLFVYKKCQPDRTLACAREKKRRVWGGVQKYRFAWEVPL